MVQLAAQSNTNAEEDNEEEAGVDNVQNEVGASGLDATRLEGWWVEEIVDLLRGARAAASGGI